MKENKIKQAECREIMRSEIKFAYYNPRKISEEARKMLKANLKRVGLLGGIVWNEQSGNLVAGHQKVNVMDEVNRYNSETQENDYPIRVEVVDMDDKSEKEQNIFMNNRAAQGEYDNDMLRMVIPDIDPNLAGLNDFDLEMLGIGGIEDVGDVVSGEWREEMLGDEESDIRKFSQENKGGDEDRSINRDVNFYEDSVENQIKRHNDVQKIKDRISRQNDIEKDNGALSYVIISFKTPTAKFNFMEQFGYPSALSTIDSEDFMNRLEFGFEEEDE